MSRKVTVNGSAYTLSDAQQTALRALLNHKEGICPGGWGSGYRVEPFKKLAEYGLAEAQAKPPHRWLDTYSVTPAGEAVAYALFSDECAGALWAFLILILRKMAQLEDNTIGMRALFAALPKMLVLQAFIPPHIWESIDEVRVFPTSEMPRGWGFNISFKRKVSLHSRWRAERPWTVSEISLTAALLLEDPIGYATLVQHAKEVADILNDDYEEQRMLAEAETRSAQPGTHSIEDVEAVLEDEVWGDE